MNPISLTTLVIDGFSVAKGISFEEKGIREGLTQVERYDGSMSMYLRFRREIHNVKLENLTQGKVSQLYQIYMLTGVNAHHTVSYSTPELTKLFDGSTSPAGVINTDIQRIRYKCDMTNWKKTNYPGNPSIFQVSFDVEET